MYELLDRFDMTDCNTITYPSETNARHDECSTINKVLATMFRQKVGSLSYLCNNKANICFVVSIISRYMSDPRKPHLNTAKSIVRCIKGIMKIGQIFHTEDKEAKAYLIGYSYLYWCGDRSDKRSTSSYVFKYNNAAISWCTKKQPVIALSSCEA